MGDSKSLLVVCMYAGNPRLGMVMRPFKMAYSLSRLNHNRVTLVSLVYSRTRVAQPLDSGEVIDGVVCKYLSPGWTRRVLSRVPRLLLELYFSILLFFFLLANGSKYSVLISSVPSYLQTLPCFLCKFLFGYRLMIDLRDIWSINAYYASVGYVGKSRVKALALLAASRIFYLLERASLDLSEYCFSVFHSYSLFKVYGKTGSRKVRVPNGVTSADLAFHQSLKAKNFPACESGNAIHFVYVGSVSVSIGFDVLLSVFSRLMLTHRGRCKLHVITPSSSLSCPSSLRGDMFIYPPMDVRALACFLRGMSVGIALTSTNPVFRLGVSLTKYNDYMLSGLPVLDFVNCAVTPITSSGGGVHVNPANVDQMLSAFCAMCELGPGDLGAMGAVNYEWSIRHLLIDRRLACLF